jgi:hypothetical protein
MKITIVEKVFISGLPLAGHCPISFTLSYAQKSSKMCKVPPIKEILWDTLKRMLFATC